MAGDASMEDLAVEMALEAAALSSTSIGTSSIDLSYVPVKLPAGRNDVVTIVLRDQGGCGDDNELHPLVPVVARSDQGADKLTWSYQDTTVRPGRTYRYQLKSTMKTTVLNAKGDTMQLDKTLHGPIVTFETIPSPPDVPDLRLASRAKTNMKVAWTPPSEDGGRPITKYILERIAGDDEESVRLNRFTEVYSGMDTSLKLASLIPGTEYSFRVRCQNSEGMSPFSEVQVFSTAATVPAAVSVVEASGVAENQFTLVWEAPADKGSSIESYTLEMDDGSGAKAPFRLAYTGSDPTYTATGLQTALTYKVRIRAKNGVGNGHWSQVFEFKTGAGRPSTPEPVLQVRSACNNVEVSWKSPDDNGSPITAYRVQLAEARVPDKWFDVYTGTDLQCVIGNLHAGQRFDVRVQAASSAGASDFSTPTRVMTDPDVPLQVTDIKLSQAYATTLRLTWEPPYTNGAKLTQYTLEVVYPDGVTKTMTVTPGDETKYELKDLVPAQLYTMRVCAHNKVGEGAFSRPSTFMTKPGPPDIPSQPRVVKSTAEKITLEWDSPKDNGDPISQYIVFQSQSLDEAGDQVYSGGECKCVLSGFKPATTYYFRVAAANSRGRVGPGAAVSADTRARQPGAPRHVRAISQTQTSIIVTWDPPSENGGSAITEYAVEVTVSTESGPRDPALVADGQYMVEDLSPGTVVKIRVQAGSDAGLGPYSRVLNVTSDPGVPAQPPQPTLVGSSHVTMNVKWKAPRDNGAAVTGYKLQVSSNGTQVKTVETSKPSGKVTGLSADTAYDCVVFAENKVGLSDASPALQVVTGSTPKSTPTVTASVAPSSDPATTSTSTGGGGSSNAAKKKKASKGKVTANTGSQGAGTGGDSNKVVARKKGAVTSDTKEEKSKPVTTTSAAATSAPKKDTTVRTAKKKAGLGKKPSSTQVMIIIAELLVILALLWALFRS